MITNGLFDVIGKVFLGTLFAFTAVTWLASATPADYWKQRAQLLLKEQRVALGGNLQLGPDERIANEIVRAAKHKEYDDGFRNPDRFPPSQNFMKMRSEIERSEVFRVIRELPKGAVLHSHDTAIVSGDYVYSNITFRENLYACEDNGTIRLRFFARPNYFGDCEWKLLSDLRRNAASASTLNSRIRQQMSMLTEDPGRAYPTVDRAWEKFASIFGFITPLLAYRPVYEDHFYRGLRELYEDNVLYLELRTTLPPLYELDGTVYGPLDVVGIYQNVAKRFMRDHPDFVGVKLIYAPLRLVNDHTLEEYLQIAKKLKTKYPSFVAGFDLVGQEDKGQTLASFADALRELDPDVNFFFHAGETDWYGTSTDENLLDAVLLNTKRIGHGYALAKHPVIQDIVKSRNIAIEISPISNQVLALVKDLRNHPGNIFFSQNFPVVISNDDPGLWGAKGLSYDFYEAFMGLMSRDADLRALKQLAINSLVYSSMNEEEKSRAYAVWKKKWCTFIGNLIQNRVVSSGHRILPQFS